MSNYRRRYTAIIASGLVLASNVAVSAPFELLSKSGLGTSVWIKIILAMAALLLLPLIMVGLIKELRAEKRSLNDLGIVTRYNNRFRWSQIKQRVSDCVKEIHKAKNDSDMPVVSDCMTDWYWRNQQNVFLEKWRDQGLLNVRHIKQLTRIKPLLFIHRNNGCLQEGSILVLSVRANMQSYFIDRVSGELIKGHKNYQMVDKLWSFMYTAGEWKVSNIEDYSQRNHYTKMVSYLPKIEETLLYYSGTKIPECSRAAA
ncbi:hypothetical protein MNBD_GAMMA12-1986 [hydrothermal vent metagenome]|uniref:Tim44-like domain-containing protein n=1 Tax=hydrothermal vent metagenome TaxID=652676 RepID=A0A3B0YZ47_9ZZZZ